MILDALIRLGGWGWLILGLILVGLELAVPGAFLIWFGLAAIATGLLDMVLDLSWQSTALVFAALSVVAVFIGRTASRSSPHDDTDASLLNRRGHSLVGRVFALETPIEHGEGRIRVDDSSWRIVGPDRPAGAHVRIVRIEGTTLVVENA